MDCMSILIVLAAASVIAGFVTKGLHYKLNKQYIHQLFLEKPPQFTSQKQKYDVGEKIYKKCKLMLCRIPKALMYLSIYLYKTNEVNITLNITH